MQEHSSDNHEREDDVERKRNRKVWHGNVETTDRRVRMHILDVAQDGQHCIGDVSIAVNSRGACERTKGGKVHQAGKGYNPEVHGIDEIATIELGERRVRDLCDGI